MAPHSSCRLSIIQGSFLFIFCCGIVDLLCLVLRRRMYEVLCRDFSKVTCSFGRFVNSSSQNERCTWTRWVLLLVSEQTLQMQDVNKTSATVVQKGKNFYQQTTVIYHFTLKKKSSVNCYLLYQQTIVLKNIKQLNNEDFFWGMMSFLFFLSCLFEYLPGIQQHFTYWSKRYQYIR